jgi:hypothetical protein
MQTNSKIQLVERRRRTNSLRKANGRQPDSVVKLLVCTKQSLRLPAPDYVPRLSRHNAWGYTQMHRGFMLSGTRYVGLVCVLHAANLAP